MLFLTELKLKSTFHARQFEYQDRGFPKLTSLDIQTTSKIFNFLVPLLRLGQLQNLMIVGDRANLVDDDLIASMKDLQSLTNLVIVLRNPYRFENSISNLVLSKLICSILMHHGTLRCIKIYCGAAKYNWTLQARFRNLSKLLCSKFNFSQGGDNLSSLDKLDGEDKVVFIQGRVRDGNCSTGHSRVVDMVCRHKK